MDVLYLMQKKLTHIKWKLKQDSERICLNRDKERRRDTDRGLLVQYVQSVSYRWECGLEASLTLTGNVLKWYLFGKWLHFYSSFNQRALQFASNSPIHTPVVCELPCKALVLLLGAI